jgi:Putative prokaryotic signal transducing protein
VGELETIARFRDLPAAQLAQGMLEAAGIPAFLADEYFVGVNWQLSYAIGGVRLQVPYEHVEEARNILTVDSSAALSELQLSTAPASPTDLCPSCGSTDIRQNKLSRKSGVCRFCLVFRFCSGAPDCSANDAATHGYLSDVLNPFPTFRLSVIPMNLHRRPWRKQKGHGMMI